MINKTLAILAGGKSSRMNFNNKALLSYKERTFIEHIIEAGSEYKEIIIVANDKSPYEQFGLRVVEDIYKGSGPLSGIHSALKNSNTDYTLCVACDMPLTSKEILNFMGNYENNYEVLIPKCEKFIQPLCSIYYKKIEDKIEESIKKNENKIQMVIRTLDYRIIEGLNNRQFENRDFLNVNTPKDFEELEES